MTGTFNDNKDAAQGFQPLLIGTITLVTGVVVAVSTHPFDGTSGPSFPGIGAMPAGAYFARVLKQSIEALQFRSSLGIDRIPKVTLQLIDTDSSLYRGVAKSTGFRGATMKVALLMWDVATQTFSSDAPVLFNGVCDTEVLQQGGDVLSITANTSHNTGLVVLPNFPLGRRCPLVFPTTHADRVAAANDPTSPFYYCGYSPDVSGGVGNTGPHSHINSYGDLVTDGSGIFVMCDYIRSNPDDATSACMARLGNPATTSVAPDGDLMHDTSGRRTGRFAGIQWSPGTFYAIATNYTSGQKSAVFNFLNSAIWSQYATLLFGTQWVDGKVVQVVESGNDTKFEVVLCEGDILRGGGIAKVVVNGIEITQAPSGDNNLYWSFANDGGTTSAGNRNGIAIKNLVGYNDSTHNALGDPYGSIARILVTVYKDIFTGSGLPSCRVLLSGPRILKVVPITSATASGGVITVSIPDAPGYQDFGDGDTVVIKGNSLANGVWTARFPSLPYTNFQLDGSTGSGTVTGGYVLFYTGDNTNPVWVYFNLLIKANWSSDEISPTAFYNTAKVCSEAIAYTDQAGNAQTHARYKCQIGLSEQRVVGELLAMVLRNFNGYTYYDQQGLLCIDTTRSLGSSQPAAIPGSNYNVAILSYDAFGNSINGFVAYSFDDSNCEFLEFQGLPNSQMPNQISITFQDEDNQFVVDSLKDTDTLAMARAGGALMPGGSVVPETLVVGGISNFDQASRVANVYMAERQYLTDGLDPRGTRMPVIKTTCRAAHLRGGHIVYWSNARLAYTNILCRVLQIEPTTNYQEATIVLQFHNDIIYLDVYGQQPQAFYSDPLSQRPDRAPLPWQPNKVAGSLPSGRTYPELTTTELNFSVAEIDTVDASGKPIIQVSVVGQLPPNRIDCLAQPPLMPTQAQISAGSIPAGTYLVRICAVDSNSNVSAPSQTTTATIAIGSTGTIVLNNVGWASGTVGAEIHVGTNYFNITHQASITVSGTTVTISSLPNVLAYGPPDLAASLACVEARLAIHTGIVGQTVTATHASPNTVTLGAPPTGSFTNTVTGYTLTLLGRPGLAGAALPIIEFTITAHTGSVLTVDRDPTALLLVGDVVSISARANIASATTIGDTNFVSAYNSGGVTVADKGAIVLVTRGLGRGQYRTITAVASGTTYTVDHPWNTIPNNTSTFIVIEALPRYTNPDGATFNLTSYIDTTLPALQVDNYYNKPLFISVILGDSSGDRWSNEFRSPFRLMWVFGMEGASNRVADGYYTVTPVAGHVIIDLANGLNQRLVLGASAVTVDIPVFTGGTISAGSYFVLYADQDATGNRVPPVFTTGAGGFASDVANVQIDGEASTRSVYQFTYHGGIWALDTNVRTGGSLS